MQGLLASYLVQDYWNYEVIFVTATENDTAVPILKTLCDVHDPSHTSSATRVAVLAAGLSSSNGEKINNLLHGLKAISPQSTLLVFADSDAQPSKDWLRSLTSPLADPHVTASTGFRWYIPDSRFGSRLQAAWDASVATLLGEKPAPFAWGGSMAIRRADFERLKIAEQYWAGAISDDYALTRAVKDSRGIIKFTPRCLLATHANSTVGEFWEWANRQVMITRVYSPLLWATGLAGYGLNCLTILWGIASLLHYKDPVQRTAIFFALLLIQVLGMVKGAIRSNVAVQLFPDEPALRRYKSCYWRLSPLVPWIMMANFVVSAMSKKVKWRGTEYEIHGRNAIRTICRKED